MSGEAKPNSVNENTGSLALDLSRRDFVTTASAAGGFVLAQGSARAATVHTELPNCDLMATAHSRRGSGHAPSPTSMA